MSTLLQDIRHFLLFLHDILCRKVTNVYIKDRVMLSALLFGCTGIMAKPMPVFVRTFLFLTWGSSLKPIDFLKNLWYFSLGKAKTKTRADCQIPREDAIWCKASVTLRSTIPLPSRVCGNATPGAPVNASMSGSFQSNQGGTVEYCNYCIPPLIFSGDGYFLYLPHIKRR